MNSFIKSNKDSDSNISLQHKIICFQDILLTSINTSWKIPKYFKNITMPQIKHFLEKNKLDIEGIDLPPPIKQFSQLKMPKIIPRILTDKKIELPTPIQSLCLPIVYFFSMELIVKF